MKDYYRKYFVRVQLVRESRAKLEQVLSSDEAVRIVAKHIKKYDREHLVVVHLDVRNNVLGIEEVAIGDIIQCPANPREIFKGALLSNAYGIILLHNHASGDIMPSDNDKRITITIKTIGRLVGVELVDHIIVGSGGAFYSFQKEGKIKEPEL